MEIRNKDVKKIKKNAKPKQIAKQLFSKVSLATLLSPKVVKILENHKNVAHTSKSLLLVIKTRPIGIRPTNGGDTKHITHPKTPEESPKTKTTQSTTYA